MSGVDPLIFCFCALLIAIKREKLNPAHLPRGDTNGMVYSRGLPGSLPRLFHHVTGLDRYFRSVDDREARLSWSAIILKAVTVRLAIRIESKHHFCGRRLQFCRRDVVLPSN